RPYIDRDLSRARRGVRKFHELKVTRLPPMIDCHCLHVVSSSEFKNGAEYMIRIPPQRGERSLAGGERSEPPGRRGTTIRTSAGVAGGPRALPGAHSFIAIFLGFASLTPG